MTQEQKVNLLANKFGNALIDSGFKMVKSSYKNLQSKIVDFRDIKTILLTHGIPTTSMGQLDVYYRLIDWPTWEIYKDLNLVDKVAYLSEYWDCDNFAYLFSSLAALLLGVNTCGAAYGKVLDDRTKNFIGYHYFNLIPTSDGKLYCYEPITDGWVQVKPNTPIIIGTWEYQIEGVRFF